LQILLFLSYLLHLQKIACNFNMLSKKLLSVFLAISMLASCKSDATYEKSMETNAPYEISIASNGEIGWEKEYCEVSFDSKTFPAKIKCRGGFSSKFEKHSYSIDFNDKISLAELPKSEKFILNANYIDKTFMRHVICYDLFREMNPEKNAAPQCKYANLTVDSVYSGLYVVMQHIDADMLHLDRSDTMAMLFKEPPIFKNEPHDTVDPLEYYDQKFPKKKQCDMTGYLEDFKKLLFDADDKTFATEISKIIDIENVIDWQILLLFSNGEDGLKKNFFLYKKNSQTPFRIAIWDCDHSFGRDGDNEMNMFRSIIDCNKNIMLKRLSEIQAIGYNDMLKKRWKDLRDKNIISKEHFCTLINGYNAIIEKDIRQNFDIWPINSDNYFDDSNYEEELELMRKFVEIRIQQLDEQFGYTKN